MTRNDSAIVIRPATQASDFAVIRDLLDIMAEWDIAESARFGFSAEIVRSTYYSDMPEDYAHMAAEGAKAWIASVDGRDCGLAMLGATGGEHVWLQRIFVLAEYRGRGVASRLIDLALAEARAQGVTEVRLGTAIFMTDAHRIYERLGFEWCAPFEEYSGTPEMDRFMRLRLDGSEHG